MARSNSIKPVSYMLTLDLEVERIKGRLMALGVNGVSLAALDDAARDSVDSPEARVGYWQSSLRAVQQERGQ